MNKNILREPTICVLWTVVLNKLKRTFTKPARRLFADLLPPLALVDIRLHPQRAICFSPQRSGRSRTNGQVVLCQMQ